MNVRNRLRRTAALAALSCAVSAAMLGAATAAHADPVVVPGCFGIEPAIYCDVTVTYELPVEAEVVPTTREVCAGECFDVPFVEVQPTSNPEPQVCVDATDRQGNPNFHRCEPLPRLGWSECSGPGEWGVVVTTSNGDIPVCERLVVERPGIRLCPDGGFGVYEPNTDIELGEPCGTWPA